MSTGTDAKIGLLQDEESPLILSNPPHPSAIYGSSNSTNTEGSIETAADEFSPKSSNRSITVIITALLIGVFIANADGSLLLATNGWIASEFNDLENASWLVTSYVLTLCAAQPLYIKLSDIYGRRTMILIAYSIFGIGCAICALGQTLPTVVAGRVISGVGGAGMDSLVNILITVPPRDVGSWRSYVNIVATTGRSLGGPVGGYLADTVGWRWSFLGQCPLTLLAIVSTYLLVPKQTAPRTGDIKAGSKLARIDFAGAFLLAATILFFLLPLEITGEKIPWTHPVVLGLFVSSITMGVLFVLVETHWAKEPIFPLNLLRSRHVVIPDILVFLQLAAQLGMMYTVPLYFQVTQDASTAVAGAHLFPAVTGVAVAGLLSGYVIKRTGRYKALLTIASACASVSYLLLILRWHGHTNWLESLYVVPGGFGSGMLNSAAFVALTATIDRDQVAMAASTFFLSANGGMAVGMASASAVLQSGLRSGLEARLGDIPHRDLVIKKSMSSIDYIQSLEGDVKSIVVGVYTDSLQKSHYLNLGFAVTGLFVSLLVEEIQI
ncbi:hypothetical protein V494_07735 [Pseudogymnoascus sp. VKM F-4513 (FW-928)]|nr:hypothetical protein V494_07735 [Pseudogymnoascus sp. VKM F-4513 (FW-928)]